MTSHYLTLTRAFIVDTAQMQNTVYDNPMKLFVIIGSELFRILLYMVLIFQIMKISLLLPDALLCSIL